MKVCPECNAHYKDSMFFCLEDGQPLKATDSPISSNPATFEKTIAFSAEEKTLNLPAQNDLPGEKTLTLPIESITEQNPSETAAWQPETLPPQPLPVVKTNENIPLSNYQMADEGNGKGKFVIVGGLLGSIALLGTAFGGWWLMSGNSTEVAVANVNTQTVNSNKSVGFSNSNISGAFGENNSSNISNSTLPNVNKATPKTSPTKDIKESPAPTSTALPETASTPQTTSVPKAPTSTLAPPTPTPTPAPTRTAPKIVSGGVVNGKAVSLVRPPYPAAARAVRAGGAVSVQVLIDEDGNVVRAGAVSGHALLRAAAEQAARASKFSPTILGGQAVKVTGVVIYNFAPE